MSMPKPLRDSLFNSSCTISNIEVSSDRVQSMINHDISQQLAEAVWHSGKVIVSRGEFSTEYRLSVYVISPEDLHRLISEEATRLSGMISRDMNVPRIEP